jgi:elongation factor 1 alpha-like protein
MSRHRNVRNLEEEDYYDDDYYDDDEYYDEDDYYIEQQREQERKKKEEAEKKARENKLKQQKLQQQKQQQLQQQKLKQQQQQQLNDAKKKSAGGISVASAGSKTSSGSGGGGISLGKPPPGFTVESKKTDTTTTNNNNNNNAQSMPIPQLPPNILAALRSNSTTGEAIRSHLSLVILGHVDAGKSTLTGRLLLSLNHVSQRLLQKYQKAATSIGKSSFALAWFTDEDDSERERGVTIDIGTKFARTEKFDFTILDAPGHKDFIPNMISGTASADCGLLVVAATTGEFEAGFAKGGDASYSGGQTREHIVLSRGLGVTQFVVAVNKLDAAEPAWSQERFEHIKAMVLDFLKQNGFKEARITFVPVSGLTGVNISNSDKVEDEDGWKALKKWYKGPTLLEALDGFNPAKRGYEKPLRAIVTDISSEGKNATVRGRVVQGFIQSGDNVVVLPVGDDATVVRVERGKAAQEGSSPYSFTSLSTTTTASRSAIDAQLDNIALAGDSVELSLANIDSARLMTGCVICHPHPSLRPKVERRFEARISVMERLAVPIIRGSQVLLHMQSIDVPAVLNKLISSEKRGDGKPRQNPRVLTGGLTATVEITLSERLVIEESNECKALGRFVLRRGGDTIAVGLIDKVLT